MNDTATTDALRHALSSMRRVTGIPVAFGGTVSGAGSGFAITEHVGAATSALTHLAIQRGNGLGGRVLAGVKAATVNDYLYDASITHEYDLAVSAERLRAVASIPVIVNGSVRCVLYGAMRTPTEFSDGLLDEMRATADRAAFNLAVEEATTRRLLALETAAITREAKESPTRNEWEAVRQAHADLRTLAAEVGDAALRTRIDAIVHRLSPDGRPAPSVKLSARETDVLALVAVGCTNPQIGERLGLERETVKGYLRNIMRKLDAHSRTQAVTRARDAGLLP